MADGYTTVAALVHLVVHAAHRHRLHCVPVGGGKGQRGGDHCSCTRITGRHLDAHTGLWTAGQHHGVGIGPTLGHGCAAVRLDDAYSRRVIIQHRGAHFGDGNTVVVGIT